MKGFWWVMVLVLIVQAYTGIFTGGHSAFPGFNARVHAAVNGFRTDPEVIESSDTDHDYPFEDGIIRDYLAPNVIRLQDGRVIKLSAVTCDGSNALAWLEKAFPVGLRVHIKQVSNKLHILRHDNHHDLVEIGISAGIYLKQYESCPA
jgi:hypothetical protein